MLLALDVSVFPPGIQPRRLSVHLSFSIAAGVEGMLALNSLVQKQVSLQSFLAMF